MEKNKLKYLGQLNLEDDEEVKRRMGKGEIKTHISLFSGCGGMDVGFAQAGFETRAMVEFAHDPCETLRHNFLWEYLKERKHGHYENKDGTPIGEGGAITGKVKWIEDDLVWKNKEEMKKDIDWYHDHEPVIFERDIKTVTTKELLEASDLAVGECSVISGGFPCQGFSLAGARVRDDPRNALYKQFVRIVDEAKPASIIGENVPGIVSMGKGEVIHQICEDFAECGYDVTWDILDAANYGVPQHRKRVILIGHRVDAMHLNEDGRMSIHIAAQKGEIQHPYLFYERLKRWKTKESKELLKRIEENPNVSFGDKNDKK